ncbi:MAG: radical SAM protein [Acidobacteriota bacterium]
MSKSIYLINPTADFPTYFGAEMVQGWGLPPATALADLPIATVAAMVPDSFDIRLCDENITPIDFDIEADFIGITGKVSQWGRMQQIAGEFRRRGRTVLIGGPFASLSPEVVVDHCDILVRGEIEEIAPSLFADLEGDCWKDEYVGTRPSLDLSPPARWDLYPNDRALVGTVQTSRGCPFECEFCDVIEYLGRNQRHKPVANILRELDDLYRFGYRTVFLADDNFTIVRRRAKELLRALRAWNDSLEDGKVTFLTQLSIDAARDDELLRLCAEAGLILAFIGIETPNEESLKLSKKRQNMGVDLVSQVQKFYDYGIAVIGGMIVGFDGDGPDIFQRQYDFATQASMPVVTLGTLVAPAATPLHDRMEREGRLLADGSEVQALPWSTNIQPKLMTQEHLLQGIQWLANNLYSPSAFGGRLLHFIHRMGERRDPKYRSGEAGSSAARSVEGEGRKIMQRLIALGPEEAKMAYRIFGAVSKKPEAFDFVKPWLFQYAQVRYMYDQGQFWDSHLAAHAAPSVGGLPIAPPTAPPSQLVSIGAS